MAQTMTRANFETFSEIAAEFDGHPRDSYSGRFMYGTSCVGVDFDSLNDFVDFRMAVEHGLPDFDWSDMSSDSMGLGMVYYWRGIQVETDI